MALPSGGGVLVAERQEVEELPQVEQSLDVVLKGPVSHAYEQIMGRILTCEPELLEAGRAN